MTLEPEANSEEVTVDDELEEPVVDLHSEEKVSQDSKEHELLTKEQVDKRQSKLDKRIFELEKAQEKSTKAIEAAAKRAQVAEDALVEARKKTQEAERAALGDTPEAVRLFDARVAQREAADALEERQRRFDDERAEWEDTIAEAKQYKTTRLANEIASEYDVDSELLVSLTDGSREKMERLAKSLPKKEADDKTRLRRPPDSGRKSTVLTNPTVEQLNNMSMEQYAAYVAQRNKDKR